MDCNRLRSLEDGKLVSLVEFLAPILISKLEKYKRVDFGRYPRILCQQQPLLPVGLTDIPFEKSVKLDYCGRCEDLYSPAMARLTGHTLERLSRICCSSCTPHSFHLKVGLQRLGVVVQVVVGAAEGMGSNVEAGDGVKRKRMPLLRKG